MIKPRILLHLFLLIMQGMVVQSFTASSLDVVYPSNQNLRKSKRQRHQATALKSKKETSSRQVSAMKTKIVSDPRRSFIFSLTMASAGAALGPFLDSYHSNFGVLQYDKPYTVVLWGSTEYPALVTSWWVPELFGVAGFLIGWLYMLGDAYFLKPGETESIYPTLPQIFLGISFFTLQYWLSGIMAASGIDRSTILDVMSVVAVLGFYFLDNSPAGLLTSAATALGGPLIEVGLISLSKNGMMLESGYHYTDLGETGFFPLWILPVYFLGGPANGNLARGIWNGLTKTKCTDKTSSGNELEGLPGCITCDDTRRVPCPNCDGFGQYEAMGGRTIDCTSCRSRGFVICRDCFDYYGEDPNDIEAIRERMSRMPD